MAEASPERQTLSWNEMLEEFRSLGGVAQNIRWGNEEMRGGLFAADPRVPVLLRVPSNLLIRSEDIEFTDGQIAIRGSAQIAEAERQFFERYEREVSWGGGERERAAAFIDRLGEIPEDVSTLLSTEFGLAALLQGDRADRIQNHFLRSREVTWRGGAVIAPVLELASRRREGLGCEGETHLQIEGHVSNEIAMRRGAEDPFSIFCLTGIAERQPAAFSLPVGIRFEDKQIVIARNTKDGVARGHDRVPRTRVDGSTLTLSYMLLGHGNMPRLPRGTLRALRHETGIKNPDEAFDAIHRFNTLKFINFLQVLAPYQGEMITTLRKMARYQLEALSDCIGSREPGPPVARAVP